MQHLALTPTSTGYPNAWVRWVPIASMHYYRKQPPRITASQKNKKSPDNEDCLIFYLPFVEYPFFWPEFDFKPLHHFQYMT
jgi:hypothetical protein